MDSIKLSKTMVKGLVAVAMLMCLLGFAGKVADAQELDYTEAVVVRALRESVPVPVYEEAVVIRAQRGAVTPGFDYEEAAAVQALRWQEMAKFYEAHGLLNVNSAAYVGTMSDR
jgi:hypothetical protein